MKHSWLNVFDSIFYINLDSSVDRNLHAQKQYAEHNVNAQRISAVTPDEIGDDKIYKLVTNNKQLEKYFGIEHHRITRDDKPRQIEIACAMSHAKVLRLALAEFKSTGKSLFLIAEDDAIFKKFDKKKQNTTFANEFTQLNFDICNLGYTIFTRNLSSWMYEREYHIDAVMSTASKLRVFSHTSGIFGTLAYAIKITKANRHQFIELIEELERGSIADFCFSANKKLVKYATAERCALPVIQESTIAQYDFNAVELGYFINIVNEGVVQNTIEYQSDHIALCKTSKLMYICIIRPDDTFVQTRIDITSYTASQLLKATSELYDDMINDDTIKSSYVVIYANLDRPNYGKKYHLKSSYNE